MASEIDKQIVFRNILYDLLELGNCIKRKTSAILIKDNMIISTGYNGTPKGVLNCKDGGCSRCNTNIESGKELEKCICLHAEENAIIQAAYNGISTKNTIMFCSHQPCNECIKILINAGVKEIFYINDYPDEINKNLLTKIKLIKLYI